MENIGINPHINYNTSIANFYILLMVWTYKGFILNGYRFHMVNIKISHEILVTSMLVTVFVDEICS